MAILRTRTVGILIALALLLFVSAAYTEEEPLFTVEPNGKIIGFEENAISVSAPENGTLQISVKDSFHLYRVIQEKIKKGTNIIQWDGCGYHHEKLLPGKYTFDCELRGESGKIYSFIFSASLVRNAQYLQFALPSSHTVCLAHPEDWFIEIKTVKDGNVIIDFCPEGSSSPSFSAKVPVHLRKVEHFTFEKLTEKSKMDPGNYTVHVFEVSRPELVTSFSLTIEAEASDPAPLFITGNIMPSENADDSEIWNIMMNPSVILDTDCNSEQKVFSEPDLKSKSLGTIHGQTQCLSVLELIENWARIGAWNHEDASYIEGWIPSAKLSVVQPNNKYGLLADKKNQTLTVFYQGKRIETLLISTGRMSKYYFHRETSAGCFVTGLHRVDFSMQGNKYDYVIQYDGGNLLHQIPYSSDGNKDFTLGKALLGAKASHACIRIPCDPGPETGVNAYWIWTHIPYQTKLIILDDPEEREKEKAVLLGKTPLNQDPNSSLMPVNQNLNLFSGETITMTFGGSITPGGSEASFYHTSSFNKYIDQYGMDYPFRNLQSFFSSDDLTCVNLNCVLKDNRENEDKSRLLRFRGLPEFADLLPSGSVEMVCLANDHILDYGNDGYQSTIQSVKNKAEWVGKNQPRSLLIKGYLFGFGACTESDYLSDPEIIQKDISILKENGCEYIIYMCYWGKENEENHNKLQEAMARACERAGADLVIGYHPNLIQGIDYINGMPVVYGLGNLFSGSSVKISSFDALLVQAVFYPDHTDRKPQISLIPVLSSSQPEKKVNDFQPLPAEGKDRKRIFDRVQKDTAYNIQDFIRDSVQ